nr:retrovirus-related Pol polyprotein from transposon TNT 1-94 [Tanacetum cinerariifolium]
VGISHETSVARSPHQNGIVERCNCTLTEAARIMLIYVKASLFLWVEAVATACLSFFHVFGVLCYPTNNSENLRKLQPKADIGTFIGYAPIKKAFCIYNQHTRRIIETIHVDLDELTSMASEHSSSEPTLHKMTPATISSRLVPISPPLKSIVPPAPEVIVLIAKVVDPEPTTKDHPLDNIIGELETPVFTRLQLHEQALYCYYDAFLLSVEPKSNKEALTQSCWIEAMQEKLNEFKSLETARGWMSSVPESSVSVVASGSKSAISSEWPSSALRKIGRSVLVD